MDPTKFSFDGINWLGIAIAVLANMVIGFLWYAKFTPTGRIWMNELKVPMDAKPNNAQMVKGLVLMLIGSFLLFFVFAHNFWAYSDAYQLSDTPSSGLYKLSLMDGVMGGLFTWLGFFVPQHLSGVAWEGKSWKLFGVNAGYHPVTMLLGGIIMVTMGKVGTF